MKDIVILDSDDEADNIAKPIQKVSSIPVVS